MRYELWADGALSRAYSSLDDGHAIVRGIMSTPTAEAIAGMLPVYIPKTDPEEAARRREVQY